MQCTWKDCEAEAEVPQIGRGGNVWGSLCQPHAIELDTAITSGSVPAILRSWVLASGGAKKMAGSL
jgi:hypothetical protein